MALLDHPFVDRLAVSGLPVADAPTPGAPARRNLYRLGLKRLIDVVVVVATAPLWLALMLIMACVVASDGHNPFYTQQRIGRNGRVFRMIKLRSMVHNADAIFESYLKTNPAARAEWDSTQKLKFDPRITRVGHFIRKTSIDELPQMFNILLGDMSLVGPRPMMVCQKALYPGSSYYEMRPGLTGFWQISNRNHCRFASRARYDNAYFKSISLRTDATVLWRTISVVVRGTGY